MCVCVCVCLCVFALACVCIICHVILLISYINSNYRMSEYINRKPNVDIYLYLYNIYNLFNNIMSIYLIHSIKINNLKYLDMFDALILF